MKNCTYHTNSEESHLENEKLEVYAAFFQAPLPCYSLMQQDPQDLKDLILKDLQRQNLKANKLLSIAKSYQKLSLNYYKSTKSLEIFKESAEYKLEQQEILLEETEDLLSKKLKMIEELSSDIEDLERSLHSALTEKDQFKKDLQALRVKSKQKDTENEFFLTCEKKKFSQEKQEDLRKIESLKLEINLQEKTVEELKKTNKHYESTILQEKSVNQKLRTDLHQAKSSIFELRNRLSEEKLKKSNYKHLYKEIIFITSALKKTKNTSSQTVCDENIENIETISEFTEDLQETNDLFCLEEEQSLALNHEFYNEDVCNDQSLNEAKENFIYVLPQKAFDTRGKLKEYMGASISIPALKPCVFKSHIDPCRQIRPQRFSFKEANLHRLTGTSGVLSFKCYYSTPCSPKFQVFSTETCSYSILNKSSVKVIESCEVTEETQMTENTEPNESRDTKEGTIGYLNTFCQSVNFTCGIDRLIRAPTAMIYTNLTRLKAPTFNWPASVQGYLSTRRKET